MPIKKIATEKIIDIDENKSSSKLIKIVFTSTLILNKIRILTAVMGCPSLVQLILNMLVSLEPPISGFKL